MIRAITTLTLVLVSAGAAAQDAGGGITLTSGAGTITTSGNFGFIQSPTLDAGNFQAIVTDFSVRTFIIADYSAMVGDALRQNDQREMPLMVDPVRLEGEPLLLGVEGDGVRLPDQRLDTVKR